MTVLSHAGLRIGEAINVRWSDVSLESGTIRVRDERYENIPVAQRRTVKDGDSRAIPLAPNLPSSFVLARRKPGLHCEVRMVDN